MVYIKYRYFPICGITPKTGIAGPFENIDAAREAAIDLIQQRVQDFSYMRTHKEDLFNVAFVSENRCTLVLHQDKNDTPIYDCIFVESPSRPEIDPDD